MVRTFLEWGAHKTKTIAYNVFFIIWRLFHIYLRAAALTTVVLRKQLKRRHIPFLIIKN